MIYTIEQIKELVEPIAKKYNLKALWMFGSYARGEATEDSDVDILINYTDSKVVSMFDLARFNDQIEEIIKKKVDIVSTDGLYNTKFLFTGTKLADEISKQMVLLYENE
jgi:predicted nucleotidyltransferase